MGEKSSILCVRETPSIYWLDYWVVIWFSDFPESFLYLNDTIMLQEIPLLKEDMTPEHFALCKKAKKEFIKQIGPLTDLPLVRAVHKQADEYNDLWLEFNEVACGSRCAACCHQLVPCITLEMENIVAYVSGMSRKGQRTLKKKVGKKALKFYKKTERLFESEENWDKVRKGIEEDNYGNPCPFLNSKKRCSIYPVRPMICRAARSRIKCGQGIEPEPVRIVSDYVALEILQEEEKKVHTEMQLVPLTMWPASAEFGEFFMEGIL